jgi:SAM-dependent methyltransferase
MNNKWWEDGAGFFGRRYMEVDNSLEGYRKIPQTLRERTECEVQGVMRLMDLEAGDHVLDCPCGYGRHSIGLGRHGLEVVGVDINREELQVALCESAGLKNVRFVMQDMRRLIYDNQFEAVINMFYSFGFFETDEENLQVLRNFYDALKPGGKLLMHTDVNVPRLMTGDYLFNEIRPLQSGRRLRQKERYDPERKRMIGEWTLLNGDGHDEHLTPYSVRVYTHDEWLDLCHEVGFRRHYSYSYWDGTPFNCNSEDMIVVSVK